MNMPIMICVDIYCVFSSVVYYISNANDLTMTCIL